MKDENGEKAPGLRPGDQHPAGWSARRKGTMTATRRHVFAVGLLVCCAAWVSIRASTASGEIVIMDLPTAIPTLRLVRLGLPLGLRLETTCPKWLPQPCLDPALSAMPRVPAFGPPGSGRLAPLALSDGPAPRERAVGGVAGPPPRRTVAGERALARASGTGRAWCRVGLRNASARALPAYPVWGRIAEPD